MHGIHSYIDEYNLLSMYNVSCMYAFRPAKTSFSYIDRHRISQPIKMQGSTVPSDTCTTFASKVQGPLWKREQKSYNGHLAMGINIADEIRIARYFVQNKGVASDFVCLSIEITTALKNTRGKLKRETEQ